MHPYFGSYIQYNKKMKKIFISVLSILVLGIMVIVVNFIIVAKNGSRISKGNPIIRKDTVKPALLVIDIQEGTTGKSATNDYYILQSNELINTINQIVDSSASHEIPVIYIKNEISNFLINILNSSLAKGSPGAELDSRLNVASDYIISKDKNDAFSNSLLDSILIKNDINKLVFTGLDLAYCVNSTIMAAVNRNYEICLINDALLSRSDSLKNTMLAKFRQNGYEIVLSNEYFEKISP
jgi:nicotinamidase-related amidase